MQRRRLPIGTHRGEHRKLHPIPKPDPRLISRLAHTGTQQPTYILSRSSVHMILLLIGLLCSEGKPGSKAKMEDGSSLSHRLFIYGTLKRGQPNNVHLENNKHGYSRLLGPGVTEIEFPLVIATQWNIPFLLYAPEIGQQIFGEIYDIDDQLLKWLDAFEGHPDVYVRDKVTVNLLSNADATSYKPCQRLGKVKCWVYFLKTFPPQILKLETYASYDTYGSHNKAYAPNDDLNNATDIQKELQKYVQQLGLTI